ncbi:6-phosphogluconolactonase [Lysobacter silvisoli]|uniref:6-phosphogluconolactonase n=1 Tax=Lysobacter silvisoli TaxID=2293254 RepID=A0A371K757_9GAMM|nr:6-phosphogluconolactonase [Lysobacter silvisoli]RDZ29687.1 6-phosphogluconolactonase [Lysobacter silvisoli]
MHAHRGRDVWTWACAVAIAAELRRDLLLRPRARLLLSGGTTPGPVYRALSKAPLEWSRVDIGLVDERWLLPDDPDSNARTVRSQLLQDHAAAARFEALTLAGRRIEDAVAAANAHAQLGASAAVLGMGEDGHTASLFPGSRDLERALSSRQAYVAVDADGVPGAQGWPRRVSLTPAGLARVQTRLLLITGERKREVFEAALRSGDVKRYPVLAALDAAHASPLHVHWCE